MPKVPSGGASQQRARVAAVLAGVALAACDVSPFVVDHERAVEAVERTNVPVETVTAFEIDAEDVPAAASPVRTRVP